MLRETCVALGAAMPIESGAQVLVDPIAVGVAFPLVALVSAIAPGAMEGLSTMDEGCGLCCGGGGGCVCCCFCRFFL